MTVRYVDPRPQIFDGNGNPLPGAKIYTYAAGTSTPLATYQDSALTVPAPNPIICDADGRIPDIFLAAANYRMVAQTSAGVTVWTADPVDGATNALSASIITATGTANAVILTSPFVTSAYETGQILRFLPTAPNTGAVTINWNGLGLRNVLQSDTTALQPGSWNTNQLAEVIYDGTQFRLTNPRGAWQVIGRTTANAATAVDFTWGAAYKALRLTITGISTSVNASLTLRCMTAGVPDSGASDYYYGWTIASPSTAGTSVSDVPTSAAIGLTPVLNANTQSSNAQSLIFPGSATGTFNMIGGFGGVVGGPTNQIYSMMARRHTIGLKNGLRILPSSGNFFGDILLEGMI